MMKRMKNKLGFLILIGFLVVVFVLASSYLSNQSNEDTEVIKPNQINFETLSKGHYSDHKEAGNYVINNNEDLKNIGIKLQDINIDFSDSTIIAVFMGEFATGGYSIEITNIRENKDNVIVMIKKTFPAPGSIVTQAFSQLYHIVKTKKINKNVLFKDES